MFASRRREDRGEREDRPKGGWRAGDERTGEEGPRARALDFLFARVERQEA